MPKEDNILTRYMFVPYNRQSMKTVEIGTRERYLHGLNIPERRRPMRDKPQFIGGVDLFNKANKQQGSPLETIPFNEPVPNILQERLTAFLDANHSKIIQWLDNDATVANPEMFYHWTIDIHCLVRFPPVYFEGSVNDKDPKGAIYPQGTKEHIFKLVLHRTTIKCMSYLGEYGGSSAWSYIAVSDYGHLIPGKIRYVENIT